MLKTTSFANALKTCNTLRTHLATTLPHHNTYKPFTRRLSTALRNTTNSKRFATVNYRNFHTTSPQNVPILPLPAALLALLKSGKLVSFVSLSSKTSLTLLPHSIFRRYKLSTKVFASVPLIGIALLLTVGLDQAPNTDRLRLVYLSEEEEMEVVTVEVDQLLGSQSGLIAPKDNQYVQWLQNIADNIARVSVDDIRDPVREYDPEDPNIKSYDVNIICDSSTLNAMCAGNKILVYDLMISYLGFDTDMMAVIMSHEIAHSIQRHFVETHGIASFMLMLGDISRGLLWTVTESLGPYVNQKLNEWISGFITMETETTYNRVLEKEADLVGLMLMAKAGYDPRTALTVWAKMAELDQQSDSNSAVAGRVAKDKIESSPDEIKQTVAEATQQQRQGNQDDLNLSVKEFVERLLSSWFGSTHPPSAERVEYMREHLPAAVEIYEKAIAINGKPIGYEAPREEEPKEDSNGSYSYLDNTFIQWFTRLFAHTGSQTVDT